MDDPYLIQGQAVDKLQIATFLGPPELIWDPHIYLGPREYLGPRDLFGTPRAIWGPRNYLGPLGYIWVPFELFGTHGTFWDLRNLVMGNLLPPPHTIFIYKYRYLLI